uniref:Uncharacterized protein n=1 Tax=viral metagenome TaxID=1070528 RepID=A0A6C0AGF7_9ZZZZ
MMIVKYTTKIRICLDSDAPKEYKNRWIEFKHICEEGEGSNESIIETVKSHCLLEGNKNLPSLVRAEGGFGGDNNLIHKQIRFNQDTTPSQINLSNLSKKLYVYLYDF